MKIPSRGSELNHGTRHPLVREIDSDWDGNALLRQKGIFLLNEVCRLLPFNTHQIRHRAQKSADAEKEFGVWKDDSRNTYLVDMERFRPWINKLMLGKLDKQKSG